MARPGGALANRPLHFILIVDRSGSMDAGGKIEALNMAIREALPHMRRVAGENPNAEVLVRVLAFSSGAHWLVSDPTPIANFTWTDLTAEGVTDMGKALTMVAEQLKVPPMINRALPPVLVLVSDGQATDDVQRGLERLLAEPWGAKSVRIAIAIGRDADREVLQRFIGDPERRPLAANHPDDLVRYIHWASTAVLQSASAPRADGPVAEQGAGVAVPAPPARPEDGGYASTTW
jgi:uncharacterized protein YegL